MQPLNMNWVVGGKRYRTDKATLIAHDAYWNGHSWEQGSCNTFLFRTPNGNFFAQYQTLLPVETGKIVPLVVDEAVSQYHSLYKKEVPFAVAFPSVKVKDA
ncbi:MAG: hypothetical protein ABSF21_06735 [Dehalococcoidia bacterium]|jgi:hypothetical protein